MAAIPGLTVGMTAATSKWVACRNAMTGPAPAGGYDGQERMTGNNKGLHPEELHSEELRTEETPGLLVVYTGNAPFTAARYGAFLEHWAARLEGDESFGVVLIFEPFERTAKERDAAAEDAVTRLLGDFRRTHRDRASRLTTGFARVFAGIGATDDEAAARFERRTNRLAEYMFGVRGKDFGDLAAATAWLEGLADDAPPALKTGRADVRGSVGLFYGSTTGTTEAVAEKIERHAARLGAGPGAVNIAACRGPEAMLGYDRLILGVPTWNVGQLQDDWLRWFPALDALDFSGKQVALFGVGDGLGFPDNFLDALGLLGRKLRARGAALVGRWPVAGYDFTASLAREGEYFIGLGVDDYNQENLTNERIAGWLEQVYSEFNLKKEVAV